MAETLDQLEARLNAEWAGRVRRIAVDAVEGSVTVTLMDGTVFDAAAHHVLAIEDIFISGQPLPPAGDEATK